MSLQVSLISPEKKLFEGEAESVSLPGSQSPFTVLQNHAPIVSDLDIGMVVIKTVQGETLSYLIENGFAEVSHNKVSALVESAFLPQEINVAAAQQELEKLIREQVSGDAAIDKKLRQERFLREKIRSAATH